MIAAMLFIVPMAFAIDVYSDQDLSLRSSDVMAWDADHGDDGQYMYDYSDDGVVLENGTNINPSYLPLVDGAYGYGYQFTGWGDSYVGAYLPNDDFKNLSGGFTLQYWFYDSDFLGSTSGGLIYIGTVSEQNYIMAGMNPGGFAYLTISGQYMASDTAYIDISSYDADFWKEWHQFTWVVDRGSGTMELYIDGAYINSYSAWLPIMDDWPLTSDDLVVSIGNVQIDTSYTPSSVYYLDEIILDNVPLAVTAGTEKCGNGVDDDRDGFTDYPADDGCSAASDTTEYSPPPCADGLDNDGDGATDGADYSCTIDIGAPEDTYAAACQDSADNDSDGWTDYDADPAVGDPGCDSLQDNDESDTIQCNDDTDNDGDTATDLDDSDCDNQADDSEYGSYEVVPETPTGAVVATSRLVNLTDSMLAPIIVVVIMLGIFSAAGLSHLKGRK